MKVKSTVLRVMLLVCMVIVCLCYCFAMKGTTNEDVKLIVKLLDDDHKEGNDILLDIDLVNKSRKPVYHAQIVTELLGNKYTNRFSNETSASVDKLEDELHLRAVYSTKELNEETIETRYPVKKKNMTLLIITLIVYIVVSCAISLLFKDTKIYRNVGVFVLFIAFSVCIGYSEYYLLKTARNDSVVHSIEKDVKVKIDGHRETVRVYASYTDVDLDSFWDSNFNNVFTALGIVDDKKDTDGDGLSDYYEMYICGSNPLLINSNNDSLGDRYTDTDGDGLTNFEEYNYGTYPMNKDTDYDGLSDYDEYAYGTNALKGDTDGDGLSDGLEIENGYNPIVADETVEITKSLEIDDKDPKSEMLVSVTVETDGYNAAGLTIDEYSNDMLSKEMPGYIGSPVDVYIDKRVGFGQRKYSVFNSKDYYFLNGVTQEFAPIESARISFELDESWFSVKGFDPCVYYYNQRTQFLEELETTVDGNIVSADLDHFSVYIVLNRAEVLEWMGKSIFVQGVADGEQEKDKSICFLLDISYSMEDRDPTKLSYDLINRFMDDLPDNGTEVSLMSFTTNGSILCDHTVNYADIKSKLAVLNRDTGNDEDSGTDIQQAIIDAAQYMGKQKDKQKYIILISDGDTNSNKFEYDKLADMLVENKISLYTLHLEHYNSKKLNTISVQSGGKYYLVQSEEIVSTLMEMDEELNKMIDEAEGDIGDGLTYSQKNLIESGVLRTGTGLNAFSDINFMDYDWYNNPDIDGDGLKNGEEIAVVEYNGVYYIRMYFNPFKYDTDGDGSKDRLYDDSRFEEDGGPHYVAWLTLVSSPTGIPTGRGNGSGDSFESGHAWLIFEPLSTYTFDNIDVKSGNYPLKFNVTKSLNKGKESDDEDENKEQETQKSQESQKSEETKNYQYMLFYFPLNDILPYTVPRYSQVSIGHYPRTGNKKAVQTVGQYAKTDWRNGLSPEGIKQDLIDNAENGDDDTLESRLEELNTDVRFNQEFRHIKSDPDYYDGAVGLSILITDKQLEEFEEYLRDIPEYSAIRYNCVQFAINAWNLLNAEHEAFKIDYTPHALGLPLISWWEIKKKSKNDWCINQYDDWGYLYYESDCCADMAKYIQDLEEDWNKKEEKARLD